MDSGSITPVDEYYFQSLRENSYENKIKELEAENKRIRLENSKINEELLNIKLKIRLLNAQRYFRDNGCIWYVDTIYQPRGRNVKQFCSWTFMPTDIKLQYYDVDHNPINHDYYDHPIYKSKKWSTPMDTITPESVDL